MDKLYRIFLISAIIIFSGSTLHAQDVTVKNDSISSATQNKQSNPNVNNQGQPGNQDKSQGNVMSNAANKGIKQVKGAKPDMSKARGARPPRIERPSGSGIPRGVGKPGGAARPGKK